MSDIKVLNRQRLKRQLRIRGKVAKVAKRYRLVVFRSNEHISLQVVDVAGKTLFGASDIGKTNTIKGTKTERSVAVAKNLLTALQKAKIDAIVFDRSYYKYHGRIKAVAETLREGGIKL